MQRFEDINTATLNPHSKYSCYRLLKIELSKVETCDQLAELVKTINKLKSRISAHSLIKLAQTVILSDKYTREQLIDWTNNYLFIALGLVRALETDTCIHKICKREILVASILNYDKSWNKSESFINHHDYYLCNDYLYALVLMTRTEYDFMFARSRYYLAIASTTSCIEFHENMIEKLVKKLSGRIISDLVINYFSDLFNKINADLVSRRKQKLSLVVINNFISRLLSYPVLKEYLKTLDLLVPETEYLFFSLRVINRKSSNYWLEEKPVLDFLKQSWSF